MLHLARLGYASKGVLYLIVGVFAAQAALSHGRHTTNTQGALEVILGQPFGRVLLAIVMIGLISHAIWRMVEAALDPEGAGTDLKGAATRLGYAVSGLIYAGLALTAGRLLLGWAINHGNWAQEWTARLFTATWGRTLVGAVGLVILGVGLYSFFAAWKAPFRDQMDLSRLGKTQQMGAIGLGRVGNAARGIVFGIVGLYVLQAVLTFDPRRVRGMQGAQASLAQHPGGSWLLGVVAVGLAAYGLFLFVEARFHRLSPAPSSS